MLSAHITSKWLRNQLVEKGGVMNIDRRIVIAG